MDAPITISGGGLIGNYISRRLKRSGIRTTIIEKGNKLQPSPSSVRTITLNPRSVELLRLEGIQTQSASVKKIHASDGSSSGKITFSSDEIGYMALSSVVMFDELNIALQKDNIDNTLFNREIRSIELNKNSKKTDIVLSDSSKLSSEILIACDGRNSNVANLYNFHNVSKDYKQTAVTFLVESDHDSSEAHQFFSEIGIFAYMPSPIESTHTVVWSIDNSLLKNISIQDFVNENLSYFEKKLGHKMRISSKLLSFNLSNHYFKEYIKDSVVLLADAAHSIHPLAGQGVNLGFADADIFCQKVENAHRLGFSLNEPTFLSKYSVERKALNLFMLKSMDVLLESFRVRNVYFNFLRGLGLKSLNKSKMVKAFFIKRASG